MRRGWQDTMGSVAPRALRALAACALAALLAVGVSALCGQARAQALEASTTVLVSVDGSLRIVSAPSDTAGSVDEVRQLSLHVEAVGEGDLSYSWSRTRDAVPDDSFVDPAASDCPLSDIASNGEYCYTVRVSDESGSTVSAEARVVVSGDYVRTPLADAATGAMVSCSHHKDARLSVTALPADAHDYGLLAAAAGGRTLACAYRLELVGAPAGAEAAVGRVQVSLPFGAQVRTFSLRSDPFELQEVLFLAEGSSTVQRIEGRRGAGRVAFEAPSLGSLALTGEGSANPGDDGNQDEPGATPSDDPLVPLESAAPGRATAATGDPAAVACAALMVLSVLACCVGGLAAFFRTRAQVARRR